MNESKQLNHSIELLFIDANGYCHLSINGEHVFVVRIEAMKELMSNGLSVEKMMNMIKEMSIASYNKPAAKVITKPNNVYCRTHMYIKGLYTMNGMMWTGEKWFNPFSLKFVEPHSVASAPPYMPYILPSHMTMTDKSKWNYSDLRNCGWTDEQLISEGLATTNIAPTRIKMTNLDDESSLFYIEIFNVITEYRLNTKYIPELLTMTNVHECSEFIILNNDRLAKVSDDSSFDSIDELAAPNKHSSPNIKHKFIEGLYFSNMHFYDGEKWVLRPNPALTALIKPAQPPLPTSSIPAQPPLMKLDIETGVVTAAAATQHDILNRVDKLLDRSCLRMNVSYKQGSCLVVMKFNPFNDDEPRFQVDAKSSSFNSAMFECMIKLNDEVTVWYDELKLIKDVLTGL